MNDIKKRCVIWGTNFAGQQIAKLATELGYEIVAYCRSSYSRDKASIDDIIVIGPKELKSLLEEAKIDYIVLGMKNPIYIQEVKNTIRKNFPKDISIIDTDTIENKYLEKVRTCFQYHWKIDFQHQAAIWIQNFMSEVRYWAQDVAVSTGKDHRNYIYDHENEFFHVGRYPFDVCDEIVNDLTEGSVVMDVGCGLASGYGNKLPNLQEIKLLAVDPLAAFYNKINWRYFGKRSKVVTFGLFEFLANCFEKNYCDLILINNALDHCIDPYKSLIECLYILKTGGKIRLAHRRAEAVYESYQGLHKWNIDYGKQNSLVFWNLVNAINVSESLKEFCDIQIEYSGDDLPRHNQWIIAYITKIKDFRLEQFVDIEEERYNMLFLISQLMEKMASYTDVYLELES